MKKIAVFLLIALLSIQAPSWAAEGKGEGRRDGGGHFPKKTLMKYYMKVQEALKLTDKQIESLRALCFTSQKEAVKERAAIQIAHIEFRELRSGDSLDMKKAEAKIREIASLEAAMKIQRLKNIEAGKAMLTEEQRNTLKKMKTNPALLKTLAMGSESYDEWAASEEEIEEMTFVDQVMGFEVLSE
ncbi:MAG: periplasmic heavy metal sensor [Candidatus Eremiobacteraeota bacterium]|nr:periplasmic heavy metal sensor [Candidatus Eremiobacteraeota bacterium]